MLAFEKKEYVTKIPTNIDCMLVADIGGTNSNFGIFRNQRGNLTLLFSLHFKTKTVENFTDLVQDVLAYVQQEYGIWFRQSCFAGAGIVSEQRDLCTLTNSNITIDASDILNKTELECATVTNDFEIIGYGIDLIGPQSLVKIKDGTIRRTGARAILGAGTGLGKCILHWHEAEGRSLPMQSEGGHADFAAQNQLELDLITYITTTEQRKHTISWEDVLSGNGIKRMYQFFKSRNGSEKSNNAIEKTGPHPDEIFASRDLDDHAHKTFELYTKLYARCAKNLALDALALAGVYIAGGIAAKNLELFEQEIFIEEFVNSEKYTGMLASIPVYVITDYNVSLYGAARFMVLERPCRLNNE
jgi:glucokinase